MDEKNRLDKEDQILEEIEEFVSDEVLQTDGVSRLVGSLTKNISANLLGLDAGTKGVRITKEGNILTIYIHLTVFYGINIPQISYDIQTNIKQVIEATSGLKVNAINISVEGIDQKKTD